MTSWNQPADARVAAASQPAATAIGTDVVPDPRPPLEDAQAVLAWKQRQASRDPGRLPAAKPDPGVVASEELRRAVEQEHSTLMSSCWNAQAPQDLEGGTHVKALVSVDASGRVSSWQVFEVPETRRPELVDCIGAVLSRGVQHLPAPERAVTASTTIRFP